MLDLGFCFIYYLVFFTFAFIFIFFLLPMIPQSWCHFLILYFVFLAMSCFLLRANLFFVSFYLFLPIMSITKPKLMLRLAEKQNFFLVWIKPFTFVLFNCYGYYCYYCWWYYLRAFFLFKVAKSSRVFKFCLLWNVTFFKILFTLITIESFKLSV